MKTKELENHIAKAFDLLGEANDAMINVIVEAVKESEDGCIDYVETCSCGINSSYDENRTIKFNENDELCMFDDYDNQIGIIEDFTANELYDICLEIAKAK